MFNTETNLYFFKKVFKIIYYLFFAGAHVDVWIDEYISFYSSINSFIKEDCNPFKKVKEERKNQE